MSNGRVNIRSHEMPERLPTRIGLTEPLSRVQMENEHPTQQRNPRTEPEDCRRVLNKNELPAHLMHQKPALRLLSVELPRELSSHLANWERLQHRRSATERVPHHSLL
jgi:hypothetical protein